MKKECVLYDRECIECGECDVCDLDPKKKCDNCGRCIDLGNDYNTVDVDLTVENGGEPLNYHYDGEPVEEAEAFEEESFSEDDFDDGLDYDEAFEDDDDDLGLDFGELFGE